MSTFNDNIRRELGFGLISWNTPEHRPAISLPRPLSGKPARESGSAASSTRTLAGPTIVPDVR